MLAWLLLCAVTLVSLAVGSSGSAAAGAAVLTFAIAKAAMVMFAFMDLARAPLALRLIAAAWLALVLGLLLAAHSGMLG